MCLLLVMLHNTFEVVKLYLWGSYPYIIGIVRWGSYFYTAEVGKMSVGMQSRGERNS